MQIVKGEDREINWNFNVATQNWNVWNVYFVYCWVYIYIYKYICIYTYHCIYMYIYTRIYMYIYLYTHICIYKPWYICVSVYIYVNHFILLQNRLYYTRRVFQLLTQSHSSHKFRQQPAHWILFSSKKQKTFTGEQLSIICFANTNLLLAAI